MSKIDVKKYKYQEKSRIFPPKTTRYCGICKKKTTWEFNPNIGHSQCQECGYRRVSDKLINYKGKIMEKENMHKNVRDNKKYIMQGKYSESYLPKLLDKNVKCILSSLDIIEGTLIGINSYEIAMLVAGEEVIIFKHGILTIKECGQNLS